MTTSPSSIPSSPVSLTRSTSLSARKTYSRKASVIREKRKAEALAEDTDSSGDEIIVGPIGGISKGKNLVKDGSPISKRGRSSQSLMEIEKQSSPLIRSAGSSSAKLTSARSLPSSPSGSRTPSPSPPPTKRSKSSNIVAQTSRAGSTPRPPKLHQSASTPKVDIHPPSSSPPLPPDARAPSTPPRKLRSLSRTNTPQGSPSAYEELFSAVSPRKDYFDSPGKDVSPNTLDVGRPKLGKQGGMRRMLTKTQSMSAVPISLSPLKPSPNKEDDEDDKSSFGGSMTNSPSQPPQPTTPSRSLLRTQSMPESPSKSSPKVTEGTSLLANTAQASGSGSGGRARRTYGGKRSMLAEVSQGDLDISNVTKDEVGADETAPETSYAELRKKYETDNDEAGSGSGNLMTELLLARAPQTVSDMRSKGENRRFMDELSCLIDGIVDPSMGMSFKRTSAIDILENMQDESWLAKMNICGQVEKVWESFMEARGDEPDLAMETICMLFLATLQDGVDQILQIDAEKVLDLLLRNLKVRDGPLDGNIKGKGNNATQKIRKIFSSLHPDPSISPSTRLLASITLGRICQSSSWHEYGTAVKDGRVLEKIAKSLKAEVKVLEDRFDLHEKGLELLPTENPPDFDHIYALLQIVVVTINNVDEDYSESEQIQKGLIDDFMTIIIAGTSLVLNQDDIPTVEISRCVIQSLQLLLLIISSDSLIRAAQIVNTQGGVTSLARLILHRTHFVPSTSTSSLGADIQDIQQSGASIEMDVEQDLLLTVVGVLSQCLRLGDEMTRMIASTKINPTCKGKYGCLRKCHCLDPSSITHHLSKIYASYHSDDENIYTKATTGYLALVISKLLSSSLGNTQEEDMGPLPGGTKREKLEGLRASLRGLKYEVHQKLRRSLMKNNGIPSEEEEEDDDEDEDTQVALDGLEKLIGELI
ncbi:hypothetical protein I302_106081 [Kwoniella bestiolae CBS 10118]|uniref:Wings apart-like protein C-terminal domain-containing protein n=1 Tax=Kwoniella bestiolae CBS 10118 TaxID=1296100 RepID=A0AAJ8M8U4_9TREE